MMIQFLAIVALIDFTFASRISTFPRKSDFLDDRIIGGEGTSIERIPYQVSIGINGRHFCGGSIIAEDWILTAAHCADYPRLDYTVRAGSNKAQVGGTSHRVTLILRHENYTIDSNGIPINDIALFRVSKPFAFDDTSQPIKLYEKYERTKVGSNAVISGWGTIDKWTTINPKKLQIVTVPIISKAQCARAYSKLTKIHPGQICAGYQQGDKDACQGDSGGPLAIDNRLSGVVSWGYGCALPGNPGVYTEISYYREWIDRSMAT